MIAWETLSFLLHLQIAASYSFSQQGHWNGEEVRNISFDLGTEAKLSCDLSSAQINATVSWFRADGQSAPSSQNQTVTNDPRISMSMDGWTWYLHIRRLKESDRGCYVCHIDTPENFNQTTCIDILIPPIIEGTSTGGDITVNEGGTAVLTCKAKGHPQPTISWRREDGDFIREGDLEANGPVLSLKNIRKHQSGAYLCTANNEVPPIVSKRILLIVNYKPEVRVGESLVGSVEGWDIRFVCTCLASPRPQLTWLFNDTVITHSRKHSLDRDETGNQVISGLRLRPVGPGDFGFYTCLCTNSLATRLASLILYRIKDSTLVPVISTSTNKLSWTIDDEDIVTEMRDNILTSTSSAKISRAQGTSLDQDNHQSASSPSLSSFFSVLLLLLTVFTL